MTEKELVDYIRQHFVYCNDGTFIRKDRKNSCGSYDKDGYLILKIKGKQYKAHRIIFAYFNGRLPNGEIDHINRNRADNRIENLREVSHLENIKNTEKRANKDTGVVGIYIDKTTKGLRKIYTFKHEKKTYRYRSLEDAITERERIKGG